MASKMHKPRLLIAGTHSGCGKTTVTTALLAALCGRSSISTAFDLPIVQPFKVGPDYIDPSFHSFVTGKPSINLDSWLLEPQTLCMLFRRALKNADLAVIEGVMGLYDGAVAGQEGSSAQVARELDVPVVLVVDGRGMAGSIAAMVRGYRDFDPSVRLGGVIVSRCGGTRHAAILRNAVEERVGVPFFGALPERDNLKLARRHLGLVPAEEVPDLQPLLTCLADAAMECLNIPGLLACAAGSGGNGDASASRLPPGEGASMVGNEASLNSFPSIPGTGLSCGSSRKDTPTAGSITQHDGPVTHFYLPKVRIGVARDAAFSFYYHDNLALLGELGAQLVFFSPLADAALPDNIHGLYLGGGFPEVFAGRLAENASMRGCVRTALERGLSAFAECGGMMYLCREIIMRDGRRFPMAGFFEPSVMMTGRLQHFGYVTLHALKDSLVFQTGESVRAHEHHHSRLVTGPDDTPWEPDDSEALFQAVKPDGRTWYGGMQRRNTCAGYPHLHWYAAPQTAERFVNACRKVSGI